MVRQTPLFHVCVHVVLAPPSVLGAWSMALVHSMGKAKIMTETMETTVFHSLHSSHLEILTVNMDILLVVMLQFKSHMICILMLWLLFECYCVNSHNSHPYCLPSMSC